MEQVDHATERLENLKRRVLVRVLRVEDQGVIVDIPSWGTEAFLLSFYDDILEEAGIPIEENSEFSARVYLGATIPEELSISDFQLTESRAQGDKAELNEAGV